MRNTRMGSKWLLVSVLMIVFSLVLAACQPAATPASSGTPTAAAETTPTAAPTATPIVLEGATTTESGLQYLEITPGKGDAPKTGDIITMHYKATLPDGTELANSYTEGSPVTTVWGLENLLPGWKEGIGLMNAGGKSKLLLPPELAFGSQGNGSIPPNTQIVIEVELLNVEEPPVPTAFDEKDLTKTESGLQYYDITEGEGAEAEKNFNVKTIYSIWVKGEDGYSFVDQSDPATPVNFVIGRGDTVFPGWEEGVTGMKVGGKRLLLIPADLGLGAQGNPVIPANSDLLMEIELTEMKEPLVASEVDEKDFKTTDSGLKYYDLKEGTGETPEAGQTVVVHYTGWLEDGTQFDSSVERGETFSFVLGQGNVIPGWDEGVSTMKVGGKRQLVIPSDLGYGESGAGGVIPPNATLIFEVELIEIQ